MDTWWKKLGLQVTLEGWRDERIIAAREAVLASVAPSGFEGAVDGADGDVELSELAAMVTAAEEAVARARIEEDAARRALAWTQIQAAYEAADADEVIADGVWEGFTRAEAKAWVWNFMHYEPVQIAPAFRKLREERREALLAGEVVEVKKFAERARMFRAADVTPHGYRHAYERIGKPTFSEDRVIGGIGLPATD